MCELKNTELRIGNLVYKEYSGCLEIIEVSYISTLIINGFGVSAIKKIPLTRDNLIAFGFYYSDDDNEFLEIDLMHKIKLYADYSNDFSTAVLRLKENEIEIKYIHQLQNLYFTLTGKELTHQKIN